MNAWMDSFESPFNSGRFHVIILCFTFFYRGDIGRLVKQKERLGSMLKSRRISGARLVTSSNHVSIPEQRKDRRTSGINLSFEIAMLAKRSSAFAAL